MYTYLMQHELPEDNGHVVSFTEYGNPAGLPILGFHGGPGSKSRPQHAERFDLQKYRVILFDQRGCGKSTPLGRLENNTTQDILADVEKIREQMGIESWFVSGGSWGSTLSLLYVIQHTERVKGILISGVFLADWDSVKWSMEDPQGTARLMPDVWERRMKFFKKFNINLATQNADILSALEGARLEQQKEIAAEVENWEKNLFSAQSPITYTNPEDITESDIASVKIFTHYEMNHEFIPDNYILDNVSKIVDVPMIIVHGRYDILCPLEKAYQLKNAMKNCELVIATASGHKLTAEGETIQRMAYDRFLERYT